MTHQELDRLWFQAMEESIKDGEMVARYHFAALVAAALKETVPSDCRDSHQPVNEPCNKSCAPGYCYCECPHGVTDGDCKECYGEATNSEPFTVYTTLRQREWPALWTGCPNCASLEDQNAELDRKLAELEQTSLELCETCGWRTVIPGEGCLNCARSKPLTIERLRDALVASRIIPPAAVEDPDEYDDGVTLFRIEALHRRIT